MRFAVVALCLSLGSPLALAGWNSVGDPATPEPSTNQDAASPYMWHDAYAAPGPSERVYFNAFLSPLGSGSHQTAGFWHAYLGAWKDCNRDGYIGSAATGSETYSTTLLLDPSVCPVGGKHNDGTTVREFLWIGPGASDINDPGALVWADEGGITKPAPHPVKDHADAVLSFNDAASGQARWSTLGLFAPVGPVVTQYAYVSPSVVAQYGLSLPAGPTLGDYGREPCTSWSSGVHFGWECDASKWVGPIALHQVFDLNDVDCFLDPAVFDCY